jgi:hypothetical protein
MKSRVIGYMVKDDFTNDSGRTFPGSITLYVTRKIKDDNGFGECTDEVKVVKTHFVYKDLLLGTETFDHCIGAVVDYSYDATQYGRKLADIELVSFINSDGEVIRVDEDREVLPTYQAEPKKAKASA